MSSLKDSGNVKFEMTRRVTEDGNSVLASAADTSTSDDEDEDEEEEVAARIHDDEERRA
jgi:hypothetical protein